MRSAAVDKAPKKLRSQHATPHNAQLRIIRPGRIHAVAGSVLACAVGFCDDADALGLQAQSDDLALEIVADLLESTDGSHVTSPVVVSSPRPPRPRWRSTGRGRSTTHQLAGRSEAEDAGVRLSC